MKESKQQPVAAAARAATDWTGGLLQRAEKGDQAVLPQVRQVLAAPEVTDLFGNLARRVEATVVEKVCGGNLAMREGLTKKLAEMRAELNGPDPYPLERHLVERVVLCWLAVHDAELRAALAAALSPGQSDAWQRRIDAAHRRHLSAVKALATVRKLAVPVLIGQLNIAHRQVNRAELPPVGTDRDGNSAPPRARAKLTPGTARGAEPVRI
ncbi:MAG TPA: hypothetical protein VM597_17215 [Gemmataceae bacterium]|nr:hypothetical protein [Gemmataceae bacterium]